MASQTSTDPTILLLDLPPKTFVGLDLSSFNSSPKFHGITNITPGLHFLYTGTDASLSIRHGRWLDIVTPSTRPQIHVFRWSHEDESLELLDSTSQAATAAIRSIPSLRDQGLVDYVALRDASAHLQTRPEHDASISSTTLESTTESDPWPSLVSHISSRTMDRVLSGATSSSSSGTVHDWTISSISSSLQDTDTIPGLTSPESAPILQEAGSTSLNFVSINLKQTWPDDSFGRDRTNKARDKSWYLGHLIDTLAGVADESNEKTNARGRQVGAKELLGEVQFCFLMVLTIANYSCLEQWKRLLSVVFGCKSALGEVEGYFSEFIKVLRGQLARVEDVEGGLFDLGDELGSQWLQHLLGGFRAAVDDTKGVEGGGLTQALKDLEEWLREEYGWIEEGSVLKRGMVDLEDGERIEIQMDGLDEEEESGEYAPVIVDM